MDSFFEQVYLLLIKDSISNCSCGCANTLQSRTHTVYNHVTPVNVIPVAVFPARGKPDVTKTGNGEWGMGNGEWGMG